MENSKKALEGKVILITGGTRGIGYGIGEYLIKHGCKVAVTGRKSADTDQADDELNTLHQGSALGIQADVRSAEDMQHAVKAVIDRFGKLDVLIANAGLGHYAPISELTLDQWNQTIDTNLTGIFNSVKASLQALKNSKGYIITIASLAGTNFFPAGSAYNASKFGVVGFTQSIMLDLRQDDVKVTTIMPGSVASHFNNNEPGDKDNWKIQPEDLGEMVGWLLRMPPRTLPSKIEVRPTKPPRK